MKQPKATTPNIFPLQKRAARQTQHHNGRRDLRTLGFGLTNRIFKDVSIHKVQRFSNGKGGAGPGGKGSDIWDCKGYFCSLTMEVTEVAVTSWPKKRQHPGCVNPQGSVIGL